MYFRHTAVWVPVRVTVIFLIMVGLLQTAVGYVGTSDSTIFYFGYNISKQNGQGNVSETDRFLDVEVSVLRSISCGSKTIAFLFNNNTLLFKGEIGDLITFEPS